MGAGSELLAWVSARLSSSRRASRARREQRAEHGGSSTSGSAANPPGGSTKPSSSQPGGRLSLFAGRRANSVPVDVLDRALMISSTTSGLSSETGAPGSAAALPRGGGALASVPDAAVPSMMQDARAATTAEALPMVGAAGFPPDTAAVGTAGPSATAAAAPGNPEHHSPPSSRGHSHAQLHGGDDSAAPAGASAASCVVVTASGLGLGISAAPLGGSGHGTHSGITLPVSRQQSEAADLVAELGNWHAARGHHGLMHGLPAAGAHAAALDAGAHATAVGGRALASAGGGHPATHAQQLSGHAATAAGMLAAARGSGAGRSSSQEHSTSSANTLQPCLPHLGTLNTLPSVGSGPDTPLQTMPQIMLLPATNAAVRPMPRSYQILGQREGAGRLLYVPEISSSLADAGGAMMLWPASRGPSPPPSSLAGAGTGAEGRGGPLTAGPAPPRVRSLPRSNTGTSAAAAAASAVASAAHAGAGDEGYSRRLSLMYLRPTSMNAASRHMSSALGKAAGGPSSPLSGQLSPVGRGWHLVGAVASEPGWEVGGLMQVAGLNGDDVLAGEGVGGVEERMCWAPDVGTVLGFGVADEVVGGGGCGRVHTAHLCTTTNKHLPCVAKVIDHAAHTLDEVTCEAQLALTLPHPNLVACLGYVTAPTGTHGIPAPAAFPLGGADAWEGAHGGGGGRPGIGPGGYALAPEDEPLSGTVQGWFSAILTHLPGAMGAGAEGAGPTAATDGDPKATTAAAAGTAAPVSSGGASTAAPKLQELGPVPPVHPAGTPAHHMLTAAGAATAAGTAAATGSVPLQSLTTGPLYSRQPSAGSVLAGGGGGGGVVSGYGGGGRQPGLMRRGSSVLGTVRETSGPPSHRLSMAAAGSHSRRRRNASQLLMSATLAAAQGTGVNGASHQLYGGGGPGSALWGGGPGSAMWGAGLGGDAGAGYGYGYGYGAPSMALMSSFGDMPSGALGMMSAALGGSRSLNGDGWLGEPRGGHGDDGALFTTCVFMEFAPHGTLLQHLCRALPPPALAALPSAPGTDWAAAHPAAFLANLGRAAALMAGVARGLAHLHDARVVHSDIKASNILIFPAAGAGTLAAAGATPAAGVVMPGAGAGPGAVAAGADGGVSAGGSACPTRPTDAEPQGTVLNPHPFTAKLGDLGLAAHLAPGREDLGTTSRLRGTPTHMAPEVTLGAPLGRPLDVYALGITLWEAAFPATPLAASHPVSFAYAAAVSGKRPDWGLAYGAAAAAAALARGSNGPLNAAAAACGGADAAAAAGARSSTAARGRRSRQHGHPESLPAHARTHSSDGAGGLPKFLMASLSEPLAVAHMFGEERESLKQSTDLLGVGGEGRLTRRGSTARASTGHGQGAGPSRSLVGGAVFGSLIARDSAAAMRESVVRDSATAVRESVAAGMPEGMPTPYDPTTTFGSDHPQHNPFLNVTLAGSVRVSHTGQPPSGDDSDGWLQPPPLHHPVHRAPGLRAHQEDDDEELLDGLVSGLVVRVGEVRAPSTNGARGAQDTPTALTTTWSPAAAASPVHALSLPTQSELETGGHLLAPAVVDAWGMGGCMLVARYVSLACACWAHDPAARPGAREVAEELEALAACSSQLAAATGAGV